MMPRKCSTCGVTRTPQWREGPAGPKTLCNACGVKYSREKGGRRKTSRKRCTTATQKSTKREEVGVTASLKGPFSTAELLRDEPTSFEPLKQNTGHISLVLVPHPLQGRPSMSPSEADTLFDSDDYQAAETIIDISRSESPAGDTQGKLPWAQGNAQGLRRSLRVQLKKEQKMMHDGCLCCAQNTPQQSHDGLVCSSEKDCGVVKEATERCLENFNVSLLAKEGGGDISEALNLVKSELQGAEATAVAAEQVFLAARKRVNDLRSQLGEIINSLDRVRKASQSPDEPDAKRRHL